MLVETYAEVTKIALSLYEFILHNVLHKFIYNENMSHNYQNHNVVLFYVPQSC